MTKNKLRGKNKGISILLLLAEFFCVFTGCARVTDSPSLQAPIEYAIMDTSSAPIETADLKEVIMDYENQIPKDAAEWIEYYNEKFGEGAADRVIMTSDVIDSLNREIIEKCDAVLDMQYTGSTRVGADVRAMIEKYGIPNASTVRRDGSAITEEERNHVLDNRNLKRIPDAVYPKTAIITTRCTLRALPTDLGFYTAGDTYYNKIEETELIAGFPVLVLHESTDGKFAFVESYFYSGWVDSGFVAYCNEDAYELYRAPEQYVTVTSKKINVMDAVLDMGARLPYVSEDEENFYVYLPTQGSIKTKVAISKADAVYGSLTFTMENYYAQAFKFLGTDYGWGGADGNVDCSGFVCTVMRSFGIYLPRNTSDQSKLDVLLTKLSGTGDDNITSVITSTDTPTAIYRPGHVMLYLGVRDGVIYIIHAPTGGDKVRVAQLTYISNVTGIRQFK